MDCEASGADHYTRFRACDLCRHKKVKCDGRVAGCRNCAMAQVRCEYSTPRKKKPQPPPGASIAKNSIESTAVEALEERLQRIEQALLSFANNKERAGPECTRNRSPAKIPSQPASYFTNTTGRRRFHNPPAERPITSGFSPPAPAELNSDPGLILASCGKFIGESSSFSLISAKGVKYVNSKTGTQEYGELTRELMKGLKSNNTETNYQPRRDTHPMPPLEIARKYVDEYFEQVNVWFPLFDRQAFEHQLEHEYDQVIADVGSPRYVALNIIIAIGYRSVVMEQPPSAQDSHNDTAWGFFFNAYRHVSRLYFANATLVIVQSLLAIVIYLRQSENTESYFTLLGLAITVGNQIGFHRSGSALGLSGHETQLRQNIFWVAYILDKQISLRYGRPTSISDHDITAHIPPEDHTKGYCYNFFRQRVLFAKIQSKVLSLLYSFESTKASEDALLNTINLLDTKLKEWRRSFPACWEKSDRMDLMNSCGGDIVAFSHNLDIRLGYFDCLICIHLPLSPGFHNFALNENISKCVSTKTDSCFMAAYDSLALMDYIDQCHVTVLRSIVVYLGASILVLFVNILESPLSKTVARDLGSMHRWRERVLAVGRIIFETSATGPDMCKFARDLFCLSVGAVKKARAEHGAVYPDLETEVMDELDKAGNAKWVEDELAEMMGMAGVQELLTEL